MYLMYLYQFFKRIVLRLDTLRDENITAIGTYENERKIVNVLKSS